jgi:hypothetical protein
MYLEKRIFLYQLWTRMWYIFVISSVLCTKCVKRMHDGEVMYLSVHLFIETTDWVLVTWYRSHMPEFVM